MLGLPRSSEAWRSWAWRAATALALLAQCWIAAAPLAEGRGLGAPAHVEGTGGASHFTHDAADCAACAVLALQSLAPGITAPPAPPIADPGAVVASAVARPSAAPRALSRSRAPPGTR